MVQMGERKLPQSFLKKAIDGSVELEDNPVLAADEAAGSDDED